MAADRRVKPVVRFGGGISKVIRGLGATSYGFRWRRVGESPREARFLTRPARSSAPAADCLRRRSRRWARRHAGWPNGAGMAARKA